MNPQAEPEDLGPVALVFPGQGSQRVGMARDFHKASPLAEQAFDEASEAVGEDLAKICFEDEERLNLTEFTQPCILTAEIAMLRALEAEFGLRGDLLGGHSLGEYTALVAAEVLDLGAAAKLVRRRGALMQEAVPEGEGAMVAVIGKDISLEMIHTECNGLEVDAANHNSPTQIVISGKATDVEEAHERLSAHGFRCVPLKVSAPFHSRFMKPVEEKFAEEIAAVDIDPTRGDNVLSNTTGKFHDNDADGIRDRLVRQISGTVLWVENMQALLSRTNRIYEIGPNRPLSGFFRELEVMPEAIRNLASARKIFAEEE